MRKRVKDFADGVETTKFLADFPIETHHQLKVFSSLTCQTMRLVVADAVAAYIKGTKIAWVANGS